MRRLLVFLVSVVVSCTTIGAEVRTMRANFTDEAPIIDGILAGGEWGATEGEWTLTKNAGNDATGNRWSAQWNTDGIYFLHQVDYQAWAPLGIDHIDFAYENLQLFFDPNTDNETNEQSDPNDTGVDGYQLVFNQPLGESAVGPEMAPEILRAGFHSEAHMNSQAGDQGQPWSGFRNVLMRQRTDADEGFGITEIFIPWKDFNATNPDFGFDPDFGDDIGLYHPHAPAPGVEWYFNIGRVQSDGKTASWSVVDPNTTLLSARPHGILQFVDEPISVDRSCDIDKDLDCDAIDIDVLSAAVLAGLDDAFYDLDRNEVVDDQDRRAWVKDVEYMHTWFGDADLDGEFGSGDLVKVFEAAEYEDDLEGNSGWATGDWSGDKEFTSFDLVVAFQDGGYERGPQVAVNQVPEPVQNVLFLCLTLAVVYRRRKNRGASL